MPSHRYSPDAVAADPPSGREEGRRGGGPSHDARRKAPPPSHPGFAHHPRDAPKSGVLPPVPPFPAGFLPTAMGLVHDFRGLSLGPEIQGCGVPAMPYGVVQQPPVMLGGRYGPWPAPPNRQPREQDAPRYDDACGGSPRSDPGLDSGFQTAGKKFLGNTPRDPAPPMSARVPQASEREICKYFLRTGTCGYGDKCRYYHPRNAQRPRLNGLGYPMRDAERPCAFYLKHSWCGFGATCKFHHPEMPPASRIGSAGVMPVNPMAYAMSPQFGPAPGGAFYPTPHQYPGMPVPPGGICPPQMLVPGPMPGAPMPWPGNFPQQYPVPAKAGRMPMSGADSARKTQPKGVRGGVAEVAQQGQLLSPGGSSTPNSEASTSSMVGIPKAGLLAGGRGVSALEDEGACIEEEGIYRPLAGLRGKGTPGARAGGNLLEGVVEGEEDEKDGTDPRAGVDVRRGRRL